MSGYKEGSKFWVTTTQMTNVIELGLVFCLVMEFDPDASVFEEELQEVTKGKWPHADGVHNVQITPVYVSTKYSDHPTRALEKIKIIAYTTTGMAFENIA